MEELLLYVARGLVNQPEEVSVVKKEAEGEVFLELHVAPNDMGKVIGRQGRIAKAIRTVLRSCGQRNGVRVNVEIVD